MSPFERVLDALEAAGCHHGRMWRCPAHEDRLPSLSVKEGDDGTALVHCFAGCTIEEVCDALGLAVRDLFRHPNQTIGFEEPAGVLRFIEQDYPALAFLVGQSAESRRWYLDGGDRERWLREQYPEVPDEVWERLREG